MTGQAGILVWAGLGVTMLHHLDLIDEVAVFIGGIVFLGQCRMERRSLAVIDSKQD